MDTLKQTLIEAMKGYAVKGLNGYSVLTLSSDQSVMTVVSFASVKGTQFVNTSLIARVEEQVIVIDYDANNKPLVDVLLQAGVPRSHIVLAYTGEMVPEPSS